MRRAALALALVTLAACGDDDLSCGIFRRDPVTMACVCPEGSVELPDGSCMLGDGGIIRPPNDGGLSDAGTDGQVAPPDTGTDACTLRTFYRDGDGDGTGDRTAAMDACERPDGYVDSANDCNDACGTCLPGGTEICDGLDNDCDDAIDEGELATFYRDADSDTFGDPTMPTQACTAPSGFVSNNSDCNDECITCRPGGTEVCEGTLDEDCVSGVDNGCTCTIGTSRVCPGGFTMGICMPGMQTCTASGEWGACMGAINPTTETCNNLDDDCDGTPDGPVAATSCPAAARATTRACSGGACIITACTSGYDDCDRVYSNGCETTLATSLQHCGSCGNACGWSCASGGCLDATQISAGSFHGCALRTNATVVCWGENQSGRLGDGTAIDRNRPVTVRSTSGTAPLAGVSAVSGGTEHTCAIVSGGVRCWGENRSGQLGNGSTADSSVPVIVSSISDASEIASGGEFTCARTASSVRCWGENAVGQLGNGMAPTDSSTPVLVSTLSNTTQIAAGREHACALRSDGTVRCWGRNSYGQLGTGSASSSSATPVQVSGLSGVISIAAGGDHTCALLSGGAVRCWGRNQHGQLGDDSTTDRPMPTPVVGLTGAAALSLAAAYSCARLSSGELRCWGFNFYGQLGTGNTMSSSRPVAVRGITNASAVSTGGGFACALVNGAPFCWGNGAAGQIGDGSNADRLSPTAVLAP